MFTISGIQQALHEADQEKLDAYAELNRVVAEKGGIGPHVGEAKRACVEAGKNLARANELADAAIAELG